MWDCDQRCSVSNDNCRSLSSPPAFLQLSFAIRVLMRVSNHRAKRYERMMKAHGIAPNAASVRQPSSIPRPPKMVSNKKRKADQFAEERVAADDDEGLDHIKSETKNPECMMVKEEVMQHQMYPPGMGEELALELMSVKEEPMNRPYDDQSLNQYVHLSNGGTLFGSNGLHPMASPREHSQYDELEVVSRDNTPVNYFTNMEHSYGGPPQDAYGLDSFEGEELIMVDAHGRPT